MGLFNGSGHCSQQRGRGKLPKIWGLKKADTKMNLPPGKRGSYESELHA